MTPSIPFLKKVFKLNREEYNIVSKFMQKDLFFIKENEILQTGYGLFNDNFYIKNETKKSIENSNKFLSQGEYHVIYAPISVENEKGGFEALIAIIDNDTFLYNQELLKKIVGEFALSDIVKSETIEDFLKKVLSVFLNSLITNTMDKIDLMNAVRNALSQKFKVKDNETIYYKDGSIRFDNDIKQINSLLLFDYFSRKVGLKTKSKFPFVFKTEMPSDLDKINKIGLSVYQAATVNSMENSIETVLGLAGAGKTYLAKELSKYFLFLHALYFAKYKKALGIGYISYSKESISRGFIEKFKKNKPLYFDLNESYDIFKNTVEQKLEEIERVKDSEVKERVKIIHEKLKNNYGDILAVLEKYFNYEDRILTALNTTMSAMEIKYFEETIKDLKDLKNSFGFFTRLKFKFFDDVVFNLDKRVVRGLKKYISLSDDIYYSELDPVIKLLEEKYSLVKETNHKNLQTLEEQFILEKTEINLDTIDFEEIEFYVDNCYLLLDEVELTNLKNSVRNFTMYKLEKQDFKEENFEALNILFPLVTFSVENRKQFNKKMLLTFVDEMLLFSGIEFMGLANKSNFMIGLGDLNQLNLENDFNVSEIYKKIKKFYQLNRIEDITHYSIVFNQFSNFSNIFDIFKEMGHDIRFLFDNFRSVKELVEPQIILQPLYEQYLIKIKRNPYLVDLIGNKDKFGALAIHKTNKMALNYFNDETIMGNCFIKDTGNKELLEIIKNFNSLIELQQNKDTLIITLFNDTYLKIKKIIREHNLLNFDVLPIQKVQALEYSNVALLILSNNEYEKIVRTHQILTLSISRAKQFFFVLENSSVVGEKVSVLVKNVDFKRL